jgi:hypothetical protein
VLPLPEPLLAVLELLAPPMPPLELLLAPPVPPLELLLAPPVPPLELLLAPLVPASMQPATADQPVGLLAGAHCSQASLGSLFPGW